MDIQKEWTFIDLFQSFKLATQKRKLWISFWGLFVAGIIYGIFCWIGMISGGGIETRLIFLFFADLLAFIWLGIIVGMVANVVKKDLLEKEGKDDVFEEGGTFFDSFSFLWKKGLTIIMIPIVFIVFIILLGAFLHLLFNIGSWIPFAGPILVGLLYIFLFFISLIGVLLFIIMCLGIFIYPPLVAVEDAGVGDAIFTYLELFKSKIWHIIIYELVTVIIGLVIFIVIAAICFGAIYSSYYLATDAMGEYEIDGVQIDKVRLLKIGFLYFFLGRIKDVPWHFAVGGLFLAISFIMIVALAASYTFSLFSTAGTITYLIIREENQISWEDEGIDYEFEEEVEKKEEEEEKKKSKSKKGKSKSKSKSKKKSKKK